MSPGAQERRAAEDAALTYVARMREPFVVIAWTDERSETRLGWGWARLAATPVRYIAIFSAIAAWLGFAIGHAAR